MRKTILNISLLILMLTISGCKKYPENRLWFKNPSKLNPFNGPITKYEVNGIDSLGLLNQYFGNSPLYGAVTKDLSNSFFFTDPSDDGAERIKFVYGAGLMKTVHAGFTDRKKNICIYTLKPIQVYSRKLYS